MGPFEEALLLILSLARDYHGRDRAVRLARDLLFVLVAKLEIECGRDAVIELLQAMLARMRAPGVRKSPGKGPGHLRM